MSFVLQVNAKRIHVKEERSAGSNKTERPRIGIEGLSKISCRLYGQFYVTFRTET